MSKNIMFNGSEYKIPTSDDYVDKTSLQYIEGTKIHKEQVGIANADGTVDYLKHINNNFLISSSEGTNLMNIDEGLGKTYFLNKEVAFVEDLPSEGGSVDLSNYTVDLGNGKSMTITIDDKGISFKGIKDTWTGGGFRVGLEGYLSLLNTNGTVSNNIVGYITMLQTTNNLTEIKLFYRGNKTYYMRIGTFENTGTETAAITYTFVGSYANTNYHVITTANITSKTTTNITATVEPGEKHSFICFG